MKPIHLTLSEFKEKVADTDNLAEWKYKGDKPALIDFYATWCGPCRSLAPILDEIAEEYDGKIYVYKIDTDKEGELSTMFGNRELHFVGLFIDPETSELAEFLERMREGRRRRNELIRLKLNTLGFPVTWDEPEFAGASSDSASIGRPHFARALMRKYGFPTMQSVFDRLLKRGCAAYVPRELPDPARAIEVIHAAGGIAVWAHPVYRERNERAWAKRIMKRFAPLGLDAVEGYYSMFGPQETALVIELAGVYNLAVSGGSDFHGANSPTIPLGSGAGGLFVPPELLAPLKERCAARRAVVDKPGLP